MTTLPQRLLAVLLGGLAPALLAGELLITLELPRQEAAAYHRPYVALFLEEVESRQATTLALWYDQQLADREGEKWLKDLRLWWRRSGRQLSFPLDGISGATRAPGRHLLRLAADQPPLNELPVGNYRLVAEVVRELGGREWLSLPLRWPVTEPKQDVATGQHELGTLTLEWIP